MPSTKRTQPPTQPLTSAQQKMPAPHKGHNREQAPLSPIAAEAAKVPRIQTIDAWNKATAVLGERRDQALQKLDNKVADYLRHPNDPQKLAALHAAGAHYESTRREPSERSHLVASALHAISLHAAHREEVRQQARGLLRGAQDGVGTRQPS